MKSDRDAAAVGMLITAMTPSAGAPPHKSVRLKGADNLAGSQRANLRENIRHQPPLHSDGDMRAIENLDIVVSWQRNVVFEQLVDNHLNNLVDILQSLGLGGALRHRAIPPQDGAVGVKAAFIGFYDDSESVRLHGFRS